ncbi:putative transcriptional regulatory protein [Diplogelasinospora grovesii]|uniref:Transcriptional regulatory protein n=1 Tax=Diplogelasinospora grovesii TaxID=303347 RepID=A0AAN6NEP8_9PEZI|nr:putative transcriptional regulatory protein [Diplogelasinospora grovesii]
MPKVAKGKRKRAYRPRTRSGCITCKIRRVKCDETHPECLRCTSTRRICDGYSQVPLLRLSSSVGVPATVMTGPFNACARSRRSFAFFTQRTCPQLAGFFGSDFWERLVLQSAHHESAIRHAIVAIGALHEHQAMRAGASGTFALEQYNLAIRSLLVPLSQNRQQAVDVCLISCLLFTCFENMQGRHAVAGSHIQSGSKLLRETVYDGRSGVLQHQVLGSDSRANSYVSLDVLATILAGLNTEVAMMMRDYKYKTYENYFSGVMESDTIFSFSSIREAKSVFEHGRYLPVFTSSHPTELSCNAVAASDTIQGHIAYCTTLMSKFSHALQAFVKTRGSSLTPKEDIAVAVLQLHVLDTQVSFHLEHLPLAYQPHSSQLLPQMKEIVTLGEKIISFISPHDDSRCQAISFCLDMGFIIPLYTVASQCQEPSTRRRAIALLRSTSRQEGLWNSLLIAQAAERIMEIEEIEGMQLRPSGDAASSSTSPGVSTVLQLDSRGGRLQYVRQCQEVDTYISVTEEVFNW